MLNQIFSNSNDTNCNLIVTHSAINSINKTAEPISNKGIVNSQDFENNREIFNKILDLFLVERGGDRQLNSRSNNAFWSKAGHNNFKRCFRTEDDDFAVYHNKKLDDKPDSRVVTDLITENGFNWFTHKTQTGEFDGVFFGTGDFSAERPTKATAIESNTITAECDQHSLEYQLESIKVFELITGLRGTIINSGGKSLHYHLHLDHKIPIAKIMQYRLLLAIIFSGDIMMCGSAQIGRAHV